MSDKPIPAKVNIIIRVEHLKGGKEASAEVKISECDLSLFLSKPNCEAVHHVVRMYLQTFYDVPVGENPKFTP